MRVDEALAAELERRGVRAIFSVPASETIRIIVAAMDRGIAHYAARHENAAVGMADGYFRASGNVGVVLLGRGPGLTNGTNALLTARKAHSGVLAITGENSRALRADPQAARGQFLHLKTIDQTAFLEATGIVPFMLDSEESAVADLGSAFEFAASGTTVAALLLADVAQAQAGSQRSADHPRPSDPPGAASMEAIGLVADLLCGPPAAVRPLIIAGRGALKSDGGPEIQRLADSIGALLGTSLGARSMFLGDPFDVGVVGGFSSPIAADLIAKSDVVLAFGASLNAYTTFGGELLKSATVVQVDADPDAFVRHHARDVQVVADARIAAGQLADELERHAHRHTGYRTADVAQSLRDHGTSAAFTDVSKPGDLDPRTVLQRIDSALPANRAVVIDTGAHLAFSARYLTSSEPGSLILTHDYGSVGQGLGIALGAAIARPQQVTVLGTGDGGFMMSLADLDTAVRYQLPLVVVILNDRALGQEFHLLEQAGLPTAISRYENPPLDEVARSVGADALSVRRLEDLDGLEHRMTSLKKPLVLDCHTTLEVRSEVVDLGRRYQAGPSN